MSETHAPYLEVKNIRKLLLFLSDYNNPHKNVISPTLAWMCKNLGNYFETYYDAYHIGMHYGGDEPSGKEGELFGSTVVGGRHHEQFYYVNTRFDVKYALLGPSMYGSLIENMDKKIITQSESISKFYLDIFSYYDIEMPSMAVMVGKEFNKTSLEVDPYCYPEIYYRSAIGVGSTISDEELLNLSKIGIKNILVLYASNKQVHRLRKKGFNVEVIDSICQGDNYTTVTSRMAKRWLDHGKGFMIGGPVLISFWIPWCCRRDYLSIYGKPHTEIINKMKKEILSKNNVVYGRQYQDQDFLELSKMNKCFQLVDPCRPVFPVTECIPYLWNIKDKSYWHYEPSDEELKRYARNGKVLTSILFWCGDLRSIESLYGIIDLVAVTKIKAGVVASTQWYQYSAHSPFELINVPIRKGGTFPYIEPLLGSGGFGICFESFTSNKMLRDNLMKSREIISKVVGNDFVPKGWFPIMDVELKKRKIPHFTPSRLGLKREFPFLRLERRPFDSYQPGTFSNSVLKQVKSSGFEYMVTKSNFGKPMIPYIDDEFIVFNLTTGTWAGWSPFIVVESLRDLISTEQKLISSKKPGWLIGVLDACLWTFSRQMWDKNHELMKMAHLLARGGKSGNLINVMPHTISRYARIIRNEL